MDSAASSDSADAAISVLITTNPCPWTWNTRPITASPSARYSAVAAFDPNNDRVLLFGGGLPDGTQLHNDLWAWDGGDWKLLQPDDVNPARPQAQRCAGMVYAPSQNCFYVFGGELGAPGQSFWKLDAQTLAWTNLSNTAVSAGLVPRGGASLTYDQANQKVVLYGGFNATVYFDDTWTFNGSAWTRVIQHSTPGLRASAAMAYDPIRGKVMLHGGRAPGNSTADLFEWNGTAWAATSVTGSGPLGTRFGAGMVFDQCRGKIVLAGGDLTGSSSVNESWELSEDSPAAWTQISSSLTGGRANHAMAFDASHSAVVVFGGGIFPTSPGPVVRSDTWLLSAPQVTRHPVSQTVQAGGTAVFTAAASAGGTLQWYRGFPPNRTKLVGQTGTTLALPNVQQVNAGAYSVDATFACGEQTSNTAILTVTPANVYPCYANCDNSTAPPILNALDFGCFLSKFAAGCT